MTRSARLPIEQLEPYLLEMPDSPAPLDWRRVFGNDAPVELEVGFGKGLFLLNAAQSRPTVNFVGVEIVRKYQLFTAARMAKRSLSNVRLACADARAFLRDRVADTMLQAIHVYFPDPWWKTRHHKRRVFTAEFAQQCERTLRNGGRLHIATDVADYFAMVLEVLDATTHLMTIPLVESDGLEPDLGDLTNFGRKFRREGRRIFQGLYEKVASAK